MAFLKFARASVTKSNVTMADWEADIRAKALSGGVRKNATVLQQFDPKQYLLSHCTIIASVDTEESSTPLGTHMVDGFQIDRRYSDYLITPETSKFINNNGDSWERKLLLATFRTFVGAENYVEHLQIPELSKGKIVDAAARDVGDSIYVDILVATDRKHKPLIEAIQSRRLQTLSMGCTVAYTQCTKCGNVADDETQLCVHVKHMKGNTWIDALGKQRKVAELCGHVSDPGSVKFIEASWVANPAFTGAVLRSVLTSDQADMLGGKIQVAFSQGPRTKDPNLMGKAAYLNPKTGQFDFGDEGGESEGAPAEAPAKKEDLLDTAVSEMADYIREKAIEKVRGDMAKNAPPRADLDENLNENLIKEALQKSSEWRKLAKIVFVATRNNTNAKRMILGLLLYRSRGWKAVQAASFTGTEILALSRFLDRFNRIPKIAGEARVYRTVVAVGGLAPYGNENGYLAACRRVIGREITGTESDALLSKGRLYDLGS